MGLLFLKVSLVVAGLLLLPPALTVIGKGGLDGGVELIGKANFIKADLESPLLNHIFWIDAGKNLVTALTCITAALFFDASSMKLYAILIILLDLWAMAVQVIAPVGVGVKPWPALDGLHSNPIILPIVGGQIVMLTIGVLSAGGDGKAKTN